MADPLVKWLVWLTSGEVAGMADSLGEVAEMDDLLAGMDDPLVKYRSWYG